MLFLYKVRLCLPKDLVSNLVRMSKTHMILQIIPFSLEPDDEIYYKNKKLISLSWSNYSGSTCMNNG